MFHVIRFLSKLWWSWMKDEVASLTFILVTDNCPGEKEYFHFRMQNSLKDYLIVRRPLLPNLLGKWIFMRRMSKNTCECVCTVMNMANRFFQDNVMHKPQISLPHGNTVYMYILRLIIVKVLQNVQEYFHSS